MPDIKTKPQMDQPKIRVVNNAPKDAGSIMKKEYAARQKEKQSESRNPVQYATDRIETTGRRGSVAAADGVRRVAVKRGTAVPKHNALVPHKQTAAQRAKQSVQNKTQRKMLVQTATKAKQGIKTGAQALAQGVMAIGGAAAAAVGSILAAGGGLALFLVLLVVIVIGAITESPFGILFSEENTTPDTVPVAAAVAQVHDDLNTQLAAIQTADSYNDITVVGTTPDWADILAVFAVKVAGTDSLDAADVVTIDTDQIARLKNVFWDMCSITPHVVTTHHPDSDPDDEVDDSWTEKDLTITITAKNASDMASAYGFTVKQLSALDELLLQRDVLLELAGNLAVISAATSKVLKNLPEDLSEDREEVIRTACSLVGKVNYFWGGKSLSPGWDDRWGQLQKVWAVGNSTTGTYRPFGLDCSGFVDWVFFNATDGEYILSHGGGAARQHSYCTDIPWDEEQIGDLVFYEDDSHVGIVAGWDENGDVLIIHCSAGYNNIVITGADGFEIVSRVDILSCP